LRDIVGELAFRVTHTTESRSHVRADALTIFFRQVEFSVGERQLRGNNGELRESIESLRPLLLQMVGRDEIIYLGRVVTAER
jgi:hypothetical protein